IVARLTLVVADGGGVRGGVSTMVGKRESLEQRKQRARRILARLRRLYPGATTALHHRNPLELLVATMLSAQCTDERVNEVTRDLFERYKTARDYAAARPEILQQQIRQTGFFRQKARSIQAACAALARDFGGQVPQTMDELLRLPGVARKTANVILGTCFGKNEGIVVDTHVGRLACRLGLTWTGRNEKDAARIEADLMQLIARKDWTFFGHAMILHGRKVCTARRPNCAGCKLADCCPSAATVGTRARRRGGG
ncbi:MAG: endonuclease III, partial [Phycisphaerae bacterium]